MICVICDRLQETVEWKDSLLASQPCLLYSAQFSKSSAGRYVAAGGSGANEARIFDRTGGSGKVMLSALNRYLRRTI